jgi:hypothetical protein
VHRYLTKMCDQVIALVSSQQMKSIFPNEDQKHNRAAGSGEHGFERLYAFEVAKTKEQEENVTIYEGFQVTLVSTHSLIRLF